jgi:hypothetical protein
MKQMFRPLVFSLALPGVLAVVPGCAFDRERPSPSEPAQAALVVEVVEPRDGVTIVASRDLTIRVTARDLDGSNLSGVGFVARRFASGNNATLDSVSTALSLTSEATREFTFRVPALPTSTQIDIYGIAYGPGSQSRISIPRSVVVAQCQAGQQGC